MADLKHWVGQELRAKLIAWEKATIEISHDFVRLANRQESDPGLMKFGLPLLVCYVSKMTKKANYGRVAELVRCARLTSDSGYASDAVRKAILRFQQHQPSVWLAITRAVDHDPRSNQPETDLVTSLSRNSKSRILNNTLSTRPS